MQKIMYRKKWKQSDSQRKAFAIRMSTDSAYAESYNYRKSLKKAKFALSCEAPGSGVMFVPTRAQHDFCVFDRTGVNTAELEQAANEVASCYSLNQPCDHYYLHLIKSLMLSRISNCHLY
jgi:hypothetical protein